MRTTIKHISLIIIGLAFGAAATVAFSQASEKSAMSPLPLEQLRLLAQVFGQIKQEYVQPGDDEKLLTSAIKGMVSSLDPHSSYLDKEEFKELQEQTRGRFAGLGIEISQEDALVKIISPIEDTPAFHAGLRPGDLIIRVDDKPVRGMTLNQTVKRMRGVPGSKVTLTIFRKKEERTFPVSITRAEIRVQSVKSKMLEPDIAYIRITSFQERTVPDLAKKLHALAKESPNLKGLVLDLRNNGGGILQSAVGVTAAFVPRNTIVVTTNGQMEDAKQRYKANFDNYRLSANQEDPLRDENPIFKTVPMVVLVNAYSASASEIVAGALQDSNRALIMGKTTFGKGSVQTVRQLSADTALRLTTAYYYTPSGRSIQSTGIKPDVPVDQNPKGDLDDVLVTREIDYQNHLRNTQTHDEQKEMDVRETQRLEEMQRLEEENEKKTPEQRKKEREEKLPDLGSMEDFMLQQAVHQLKGEPVQRTKSRLEANTALSQ
ncbi:S41 family peptidase [Candidatus Pandoraea novymonadis]|uniref:CtpA-like serine protease n=1 Tax=Candidatus Pandoraea novymonadis TaxID=1808959 RepID=A0ABX5FDA4_9BURK|nr:S41 family peptidase [Candidatus Pandoraea novymonadis]PSB91744.1 putative CtpA-like serine protease [Candidatus Pandoraea novymonadis]